MTGKKYQIIYADPPWPIKWINSNTVSGGHPRNATEHIVEGTAGFIKTIGTNGVSATNNWFIAERGDHSEKPEEARKMIERFYPTATKIELFARKRVDGWDAWGNEINSDVRLEVAATHGE